jgi:hypothetical protein
LLRRIVWLSSLVRRRIVASLLRWRIIGLLGILRPATVVSFA